MIEGNRAWKAASQVRKRWLATVLFARRAAPRQAAPFVARTLLAMADPVRTNLAIVRGRQLFGEVTGTEADKWLEACDTTAAARLPLLMLAPIVTAFEQAMTEGDGVNTWRTDRYAPCPRREAARYLSFLASAGYQLSVIEQALADDVPYTGDNPAEPGPAGQPAAARSPGTGNDDSVPAAGDGTGRRHQLSPGNRRGQGQRHVRGLQRGRRQWCGRGDRPGRRERARGCLTSPVPPISGAAGHHGWQPRTFIPNPSSPARSSGRAFRYPKENCDELPR